MHHLSSTLASGQPILALLFSLLPIVVFAQVSETREQTQFPQQLSASQLLEACASSLLTATGRERRKYCAGFVSGVEEAVRILQEQHKLEPSMCLPRRVSAKTLSDVFIRYSASRQQKMDKPAAITVLQALSHNWPCKEAD